jgi:hypothetical protein
MLLYSTTLSVKFSSAYNSFNFFISSKTFIKFINEIAYFNNTYIILKLASKEESKEFYKCRSLENKSIEYKWSDDIFYTINPSDLLIIL